MKIFPFFVGRTDAKIAEALFEPAPETVEADADASSYEDVKTAIFVCFGGGFFVARSSS